MILEKVRNRKYLSEDWQELNVRDGIREELDEILSTERVPKKFSLIQVSFKLHQEAKELIQKAKREVEGIIERADI